MLDGISSWVFSKKMPYRQIRRVHLRILLVGVLAGGLGGCRGGSGDDPGGSSAQQVTTHGPDSRAAKEAETPSTEVPVLRQAASPVSSVGAPSEALSGEGDSREGGAAGGGGSRAVEASEGRLGELSEGEMARVSREALANARGSDGCARMASFLRGTYAHRLVGANVPFDEESFVTVCRSLPPDTRRCLDPREVASGRCEQPTRTNDVREISRIDRSQTAE